MIKYRIQNVDAVRFFQVMLALLITTVIMAGEVSPVYAAEAANVVTAKFTSLQNLVSGIVSSIGSIITLFRGLRVQCRQTHSNVLEAVL